MSSTFWNSALEPQPEVSELLNFDNCASVLYVVTLFIAQRRNKIHAWGIQLVQLLTCDKQLENV